MISLTTTELLLLLGILELEKSQNQNTVELGRNYIPNNMGEWKRESQYEKR